MKSKPIGKPLATTVPQLKALAGTDFHPDIVNRQSEFKKLLEKITKTYSIDDEIALGKAIDLATRMYYDKNALSSDDVKALLKSIPKVTSVWLRKGNDKLIADVLVQREDARIRGGKYDPIFHGRTIAAVWQVGKQLVQLEHCLKELRRRRRPADVGLHSAIGLLERAIGRICRERNFRGLSL